MTLTSHVVSQLSWNSSFLRFPSTHLPVRSRGHCRSQQVFQGGVSQAEISLQDRQTWKLQLSPYGHFSIELSDEKCGRFLSLRELTARGDTFLGRSFGGDDVDSVSAAKVLVCVEGRAEIGDFSLLRSTGGFARDGENEFRAVAIWSSAYPRRAFGRREAMSMLQVSSALVGRFQGRSSLSETTTFPDFLPREVEKIRDRPAREMAKRIQRLPVQVSFSESSILSSCVMPLLQSQSRPIVLLHCFDSSCLEWRYAYPLLESYGLETWALDILGWGFSDLESLPSSSLTIAAKREHLYQFWRSYIQRPMILVGPSLGAAVAIDFAAHHPEAVSKFILIGASVYAEGATDLAKLPRAVVYAGASLLKNKPLRLYASYLALNRASIQTIIDYTNIGYLHCLLPWWEEATVDFMTSGGYKVSSQIGKVKKKTLIIWGKEDRIVNSSLALRLHRDLPGSVLHQIPDCGHVPHVEKPVIAAQSILKFIQSEGLC